MLRLFKATLIVAALTFIFVACGGGGGSRSRFEGDWTGFYDGPGPDDGSFFVRIDGDGRGTGFDNVHNEDCNSTGDLDMQIRDTGEMDYFMDFVSSKSCVAYSVDGQGDLDPGSGGWEGNTSASISSVNGTSQGTYFIFMERGVDGRKPTMSELRARAKEMRAKVASGAATEPSPDRQKVFK